MTPEDLRAIRNQLGHTQHSLAEALNMGTWGWQSINKFENGKKAISEGFARRVNELIANPIIKGDEQ